MDFFGIGTLEILFIFLIAFLLFGPKRIYDISRNIGHMVRSINRTATDFTVRLEREIDNQPGTDVKESSEKDRGTAVG